MKLESSLILQSKNISTFFVDRTLALSVSTMPHIKHKPLVRVVELSLASQSDFSLRNYNSADYSTSIQWGEGVSSLWVGGIYRANTGTVF